ncbi:PTS system glucitol/sorbitol-specific transporter subunit IIA [Cedecea lapagei]|uniref:PTS system glucitol/sorbitol-specific transporter subunit IIA n=1 Tax=Cedecea lapagei TaxID=158823 RepID=A0A447UXD8_9ENTR|nr:PTS glucitol/sorbitol transporter subunit IIA [Cedecea lapagei]VEB95360.1 PTS system glucitol/sorbitol-specific transporter subunit IIA [Cedecea lapagei]
MIIYGARIVQAGPLVEDGLAYKMLITFDANGPADCLDYALALRPEVMHPTLPILPDGQLQMAGKEYRITAVGHEARHNLFELAHLTLIFDANLHARHAGCLHLSGTCPSLADLEGNLVISEAIS